MPLGNGNAKSGDKGSNWKYEFQVLTGLQAIVNNTGASPTGTATAANQVIEIGVLNNILSAIANGQAYTQALVTDNGGAGCPTNCPVYLEVRVWDPVTQTFGPPVYYNASGGVVTPVGPLTFVNDAFSLTSILTQVTAINAKTPALGQAVSAASVPVVIASDQSAIPISATSLPLPTGAATSALQTTGNTSLASLVTDFTTVTRTPGIIINTASSNLGTDSGKSTVRSFSVYNQGSAAATILGQSIPAGVRLSWSADGQGDTYTASGITYNGTGTTLIITYSA